MDKLIEQVLASVPRKILGGLVAMMLIMKAAEVLNIDTAIGKACVIIAMTFLGFVSIGTHYLLEKEKPEVNDENPDSNNY